MNRLKKSTIYKIIINFHFIIMFLNTCATSQVALSALEAVKPLPLPQEGLANHEVISLNVKKFSGIYLQVLTVHFIHFMFS